MKKYIKITLFLLSVSTTLYSQEFVYEAKNPAFGGASFNYQWLLSSADAQNGFTEDTNDVNSSSQLDNFTNNLNRQFLSRINRILLNEQLPTNEDLAPGNYTFGSLSVEVYDSTAGLVVNILDTDTGEQTQVIIP